MSSRPIRESEMKIAARRTEELRAERDKLRRTARRLLASIDAGVLPQHCESYRNLKELVSDD